MTRPPYATAPPPGRRVAALTAALALACVAEARADEGDREVEGPAGHALEPAGDDEEPEACVHGGHHKEHTRNLLGGKLIGLVTIARAHAEEGEEPPEVEQSPFFGGSVFYERELLRNKLEFEIQFALVTSGDVHVAPMDILLKRAFHAHHRVTPYIGGGPALELVTEGDEREVLLGMTAASGVYLWFTRSFGVDIELDYTLLVTDHGIEHAPCFGIGPVAHF